MSATHLATSRTTSPSTSALHPGAARPNGGARLFSDTATIVQRNLITIRRVPQLLVFATIQPIIFVLMFRYVFGGAIPLDGVSYVDYLMPGIFAQTVAFGAIGTGIGLSEDLAKGLIDRFRSLPMAPSAVLLGRTVADVVRNVFVQVLMVAVGFLVGFRIHAGVPKFVLAIGVLLGLGFALSWLFGLIGLIMKNAETTQAAAFPIMAPLVFASNAFVNPATMPSWLQGWARNQPLSVAISTVRRLTFTDAQAAAVGITQSTTRLLITSSLWIVGLSMFFGVLAVHRYRQVA